MSAKRKHRVIDLGNANSIVRMELRKFFNIGNDITEDAANEEQQMEEFLFGKNILASKSQWEDMEEAVQVKSIS